MLENFIFIRYYYANKMKKYNCIYKIHSNDL